MSKEGVLQNAHDLYWEQTRVLNPGRIAALILSEDNLNLLRREIQRNAGYHVDRNTLYEILVQQVLRPSAPTVISDSSAGRAVGQPGIWLNLAQPLAQARRVVR